MRTGKMTSAGATTTAAAQLLGSNPNRVALIISSHNAGHLVVGDSSDLTATSGIRVPTNTQALRLTVEDVGDWIKRQIWGIAATASWNGGILEIEEA